MHVSPSAKFYFYAKKGNSRLVSLLHIQPRNFCEHPLPPPYPHLISPPHTHTPARTLTLPRAPALLLPQWGPRRHTVSPPPPSPLRQPIRGADPTKVAPTCRAWAARGTAADRSRPHSTPPPSPHLLSSSSASLPQPTAGADPAEVAPER
jgi:hypothetical protein